jgi:cobalt/nickel transport system ATP-binding protein
MSLLHLRASAIGYDPSRPVLRDVALHVAPGEAVALLGGNGAGKTALLRFIAGLLPAADGVCEIAGQRVRSPQQAVAAGVGLLVQDPDDQLLGTTLEQDTALGPRNLGCSPAEVVNRVTEALETIELQALRASEISSLSLGEKKRAALAGVLAMQPQLLLLDEPSAGLDPQAERAVCQAMVAQRERGRTLIVATHAVDLVPYFATRVLVLAEGQVLADGSCREVLTQGELLTRARVRMPWPVELWQRTRPNSTLPTPLTMEDLLLQLEAAD